MFVDKDARAEALSYVKGDATPDVFAPPSDQAEITTYLTALKPGHYVALAQLIDLQLETTFQNKAERPPNGLLLSPYRQDADDTSPFDHLRADAVYTFAQDLNFLKVQPLYQQTAEVTAQIGKLDSDRYTDLDWQLYAGLNTALNTMTKLLESIPAIVQYHQPGADPTSYPDIAKSSVGLPWTMAMMCVNKMMTLQGMVSHQSDNVSWRHQGVVLDPEHFTPTYKDNAIATLRFKRPQDIEIPEGYSPHPGLAPTDTAMKLGDVACHQEITIGCPITLLPHRLHDFWNWLIEVTEQQELWPHES